jgi:hypothetical protein
MKKTYFLALLLFLGAGCAPTVPAPAPSTSNDATGAITQPAEPTTNTTAIPIPTPAPTPTPQPTPTPPAPQPTIPGYTMTDVTEANAIGKCWSVVYGKVYDLTDFIYQHPGGEKKILSMCGKDATSAYDNQHGGQEKAQRELDKLFIGNLK